MNDLEIAPLAQRLAEENNVDWRRLQGSGANGRIVERDVLAFLARVMAGEEAVDPTPEPLPDGMEAWPDASGPGAEPPRPAGHAAGDAPATGTGAWAGAEAGDTDVDALAEDEDLLLAGDDLTPADEGDLLAPPEAPPAPVAAEEDLPDLFDDGDRGDGGAAAAEDDAPDLFDGDLTWDADDAPSRAGADAGPASAADDSLDFAGFPGAGASRDTAGAATDASAANGWDDDGWGADAWGDEPDLGRPVADAGMDAPASPEPVPPASASPEPASPEPTWRRPDEEPALEPDEGPMAPVADLGAHAPEGSGTGTSDLGRPAPAQGTASSVGGEARPDAAQAPVDARPDAFGASEAGTAAAAATAAAEEGAPAAGLPLARSRQVLRRHVDFGGALALQRMLAADTGRDDLAVPALLLLAARRAGPLLDVERPGLVRPAPEGGFRAAVVRGDGLGALARALAAGTDGSEPDADLWVADLSGYGLDDALLDAEGLQLTLGRILSDGDDGRVRATLALAGDVPLDRGAAFLGRVAELIEEPLRLLL